MKQKKKTYYLYDWKVTFEICEMARKYTPTWKFMMLSCHANNDTTLLQIFPKDGRNQTSLPKKYLTANKFL
jgi:hypothetical protein